MLYLKLGIVFLTSLLMQVCIVWFFQKKQLFQAIYALSPKSHQLKAKTPSLGGIGLCISLWVGMLVFKDWVTIKLLWIAGVYSLFACIGLYDDCISLFKGKNQGLSAGAKSAWQCGISILCLIIFSLLIRPLGLLELIFFGVVMVGASNATNLTDGLDGLLGGCSIITCLGFLFWIHSYGGDASIEKVLVIIIMSLCGFLVFNWYPARIFMGDTGSLALGAFFAAIAITLDCVWILLSFGSIYVIEALSVMIQVGYYKWCKKRVFLMSPLHHHFELCGMKETHIVLLFWGISLILVYATGVI